MNKKEFKREYLSLRDSVLAVLPHTERDCDRLAAEFYPAYWTYSLEPRAYIGLYGEDLRPWYRVKVHREEDFFQAIAVLPAVARGEVILEDNHGKTRWQTECGRYFYYNSQIIPYLEITVPTMEEWSKPLLAVPFIVPAKIISRATGSHADLKPKPEFLFPRFPELVTN